MLADTITSGFDSLKHPIDVTAGSLIGQIQQFPGFWNVQCCGWEGYSLQGAGRSMVLSVQTRARVIVKGSVLECLDIDFLELAVLGQNPAKSLAYEPQVVPNLVSKFPNG